METIIIQAIGAVAFLLGTVVLGFMIRRVRTKILAERASRISHLLYWSCLVLPGLVAIVYPGLTRYDGILGLRPIPMRSLSFGLGTLLFIVGLALLATSSRALGRLGKGTAAFLLTKQIVSQDVYRWTRNPMSLGYYCGCLGVGLMAGSSSVTLGVLFVIIPVHVINLRYFEERELEQRYGESYIEFKKRVPFLIPRFNRGEGNTSEPGATDNPDDAKGVRED
jgi:protein-S-isoprenylcysteine O-methyltransferase Ste14